MATKYYAKDANTDTNCDYVTGTPYDLATSTGTPTTHTVDTSGIASWQTVLTYDLNIGTGLMSAGDVINFSISLNSVSNSDVRLWLQYVAVTPGCTIVTSSTAPFSSTWSAAGVRLLVDMQRNTTHGSRSVIVDVESTNTWIEGPWGGAGPTTKTGSVL